MMTPMNKRERQAVAREVIQDISACSTAGSKPDEQALYEKLRRIGLKAAKVAVKKALQ